MYVEDAFIYATNFADDEMKYANNSGIVRIQAVADKSENRCFGEYGEATVVQQTFVNVTVDQGSIYMAEKR
jgi:hypothetical protein